MIERAEQRSEAGLSATAEALDKPSMSGFTETVQGNALVDDFDDAEGQRFDNVERVFDTDAEHDQRQRRLSRLGILLILAFLLPSPGLGLTGQTTFWPQFTAFPGCNLFGLAMFLPLLAGVLTLVATKATRPPLRAALLLIAGLSPLGLLVALGSWTLLRSSQLTVPATMYLWIIAALLLLVANRVRSYRPMRHACSWIGVAGVACYVAHLLFPVQGQLPVVEIAKGFDRHTWLTVGLGLHVIFMARVCWVTLRNKPTRNAFDASDDASRATRAWVLAAVTIGITFTGLAIQGSLQLAAFTESFEPLLMGLSATIKATLTIVGFAILVPVAIADLWIGRT